MASRLRRVGGTSRLRGIAQRPGDQPRAAARYHGDQAAVPGMLDFAVNVRAGGPPSWLVDRPAARLTDLDRYPSAPDQRRAVDASARHGRGTDEVALLAGAPVGLRVGYVLGAREVLNRLTAGRPHWPLSTLRLEAIAACSAPHAVAEAEVGARQLASLRAAVRPESPMLVDAIVEVLR